MQQGRAIFNISNATVQTGSDIEENKLTQTRTGCSEKFNSVQRQWPGLRFFLLNNTHHSATQQTRIRQNIQRAQAVCFSFVANTMESISVPRNAFLLHDVEKHLSHISIKHPYAVPVQGHGATTWMRHLVSRKRSCHFDADDWTTNPSTK